MNKDLRILKIETGFLSPEVKSSDVIDYSVYKNISPFYRKLEEYLRLDIYLAKQAKLLEIDFDILWARSEKVGIPLSFLRLHKPLVVFGHYLESPLRAKFIKYSGISTRWAAVGYTSIQSKHFYTNYFDIPSSKLFQFESAKYLDQQVPERFEVNGPIMSVGVAKRDYKTLILALTSLPGYQANLFISSKFGDKLSMDIRIEIPKSIHIMGYVSQTELIDYYRKAKFIIVPLKPTTHNSAGINAVLEAGAFGKAVIATGVGGMPYYIKNEETGILVPPNDVYAMRNAISTLWNQPKLAHRMGIAGRNYMEQEFNPKKLNENIIRLMQSLCDN